MLEAGRTGAHAGTKESNRQHDVGEGYSFPSSDVEQLAREQETREATEQAPTTTKELIDATESAVDTLVSILARNDAANEALNALSERVLFYLRSERESFDLRQANAPTPFAKALVKSADQRTVDEELVVSQITKMIVSEVNPILFQLRKAIVEHNEATQAGKPADDLFGQNEGLLNALKTGKVENQTTTTLFGYLEGLSATEAFVPSEFVVLNPLSLSQKNTEYWDDYRAASKEVTENDVEISELIAARSLRAVYELDQAAERYEAEGKEHVADQFAILAQFINDRIDPLQNDFKKTTKALSFFNADALGVSGTELVEVLSASEHIKRVEPLLYARLIGIAPGRQGAQVKNSDLYGNAFHIALDKSLRSKRKPKNAQEIAGHKIIKDYLDGLTQKDAHQLPMSVVSDAQLDQMQQRLKTEISQEAAQQNTVLLVSLVERITSAHSAKSAREFLEGVSEVKEQKAEKEAYLRDFDFLMEEIRRIDDTQTKEQLRSISTILSARRGNVSGAFLGIFGVQLLREGEKREITGNQASAVIEIARAIPVSFYKEYVQECESWGFSQESIFWKRLIIAERCIEEGQFEQAYEILQTPEVAEMKQDEIHQGHKKSEKLLALASAMVRAGQFDRAEQVFEEVLESLGVLVPQNEKFRELQIVELVNAGLVNRAYNVYEAVIAHRDVRYEIKDLLFNALVEKGDFQRADKVRINIPEGNEHERLVKLLTARHNAGEDVSAEYEAYAKVVMDPTKLPSKHVDAWLQLIKLTEALGIDLIEIKRALHASWKAWSSERKIFLMIDDCFGFLELLSALDMDKEVAEALAAVDTIYSNYQKAILREAGAWLSEPQVDKLNKLNAAYEKVVSNLLRLGFGNGAVKYIGRPVLVAGNPRDILNANVAKSKARMKRALFFFEQELKMGKVEDAEDTLKKVYRYGRMNVGDKERTRILEAYVNAGMKEKAWRFIEYIRSVQRESDVYHNLIYKTALQKISAFTNENPVTEYNQLVHMASYLDAPVPTLLYEHYLDTLGIMDWDVMERMLVANREIYEKHLISWFRKLEAKGVLEHSMKKGIPAWVLLDLRANKELAFMVETATAEEAAQRGATNRAQESMRRAERLLRGAIKKQKGQKRESLIQRIALAYAQMGNFQKAFSSLRQYETGMSYYKDAKPNTKDLTLLGSGKQALVDIAKIMLERYGHEVGAET